MNIIIETLVIVAVREEKSIFQGMWTITPESADIKRYYFYRCEAETIFELPADIQISELYSFGPNGLTNASSEITRADALYLLKHALFETIHLMDTVPKKQTFSTDQDLGEMVERLVPQFNKEQLLALPDEIGFATSIDFKPNDDIGINAAKLLIDRPNLQ